MEQPHQHGPNCKHGHGHGQGHGHSGHNQMRPTQLDPKQYFQKLNGMKQNHIQFYWMQILSGVPLNKFFEKNGLDFLRSINSQVIMMIVAQAQMMFTCQWLPLFLRPFISGLFFPLIFLIFFNFNVIFGVEDLQYTFVHLFAYLTILFYVLTALKEAGSFSTPQYAKKTQQVLKQRPYLENMMCHQCKILKILRSNHCPICKICVPKFTRHSLAFGSCIGANNQILAWSYFTCLSITQFLVLITFFINTEYGIITNIMFYALNISILWISFVESATFFILNFYYGITQHEVRSWMMCLYLIKIPDRVFVNCINKGLCNNIKQSVYALFSIQGYQSEKKKAPNPLQQEIPISGNYSSQFEVLDKNKTYLINWSKAFFYLTPHVPTYCSRDTVIQMMSVEQPRMIKMFKLQKQFKEQVIKETQGQQLNQFQIQQRVMMKMQQHMMKNQPQMMMGQGMSHPNMRQPPQNMPPGMPTPQQQKMMQIQMLTHMSTQLQNEPEFAQRVKDILSKLKEDKMTPIQVGLAVRHIQQDLMKKKMQSVMKQKAETQEKQKEQTIEITNQDQQEQLKKQQIPDEDL